MSPKVSIIIVNFNGREDTLECLDSLKKLDYDNFDVILIDNASQDPIKINPVDFSYPIDPIMNQRNLGFAGANNQGMRIALERGADYVLLLNNDTVVSPDFLKMLVRVGEKNAKIGIVGPLINFYPPSDDEKIWAAGGRICGSRGELISYGESDKGQYELKKVDYISGTCLLAKKTVMEKIGFLPEEYFLYYEDTDWCASARRAGFFCLLVPETKIWHKHSKSTVENSYPYVYYHIRNGLIFGAKFGNIIATYVSSGWIFLKQLIKLTVGYNRDWARPAIRGVKDFWSGKTGKLEGYY